MNRWMLIIVILLSINISSAFDMTDDEILNLYKSSPTKDKYPDAKAIILKKVIEYNIDENGLMTMEEFDIIKLNTFSGMKEYENYKINYNGALWDLKLEKSFTINPDGTTTSLKDNEMNIAKPTHIPESGMQYAVSKMMVLSYPNLTDSSGILIHYKLVTPQKPDRPIGIDLIIMGEDPVLDYELKVKYPPNMKPLYKVLNGGPETIFEKGLITIKAHNLEGFNEEPSSPPLSEFCPRFVFTLNNDWTEISKYFWSKYYFYLSASERIKHKANELSNDPSKIYLYVADSIRNVDINFNDEEIKPFNSDTVFSQGYGDALQKSILFGSFMRAIGYETYPLLVPQYNTKIIDDIPMFRQFRSFVMMAVKDKDTLFCDLMTDTSPMGYIPNYSGQKVFMVKEFGYSFYTLPSKIENMVEINANLDISNLGGINVAMNINGTGSVEDGIRSYFKGEKQRKIRMKCEEIANEFGAGVKLKEHSVSKVEDLFEPLIFNLSFQSDSFAFLEKYMMVFTIPEMEVPFVEFNPSISIDERKIPLNLDEPFIMKYNYDITAPDSFEIVFYPKTTEFNNNLGEYKIESSEQGNGIKISYQLKSNRDVVKPSEYPAFLKLMRDFKSPKNWVILLKAKGTK